MGAGALVVYAACRDSHSTIAGDLPALVVQRRVGIDGQQAGAGVLNLAVSIGERCCTQGQSLAVDGNATGSVVHDTGW